MKFLLLTLLTTVSLGAHADFCDDQLSIVQQGFKMTYKLRLTSLESWVYDKVIELTGDLKTRDLVLESSKTSNGTGTCLYKFSGDMSWDTTNGQFRIDTGKGSVTLQYVVSSGEILTKSSTASRPRKGGIFIYIDSMTADRILEAFELSSVQLNPSVNNPVFNLSGGGQQFYVPMEFDVRTWDFATAQHGTDNRWYNVSQESLATTF